MPNSWPKSAACALAHCRDYSPGLGETVAHALEAANMPCKTGMRVLVKPNLLTARQLACTHPAVVAAACKWLLERGCKVEVADSPAFGRAETVAHAIGLDSALAPLGLEVLPMDKPRPLTLDVQPPAGFGQPTFMVSRRALDCDFILSMPKIKAHSQMRITLAVKNSYGCVCGLRKAIIHAREGRNPDFFAACIAALWSALPPMGGLVDGVIAMTRTGPGKGDPFSLGLIGASSNALALDMALLEALGISPDYSPLHKVFIQRPPCSSPNIIYPLARPAEFDAAGFVTPATLAHTSFRPARLVKSLWRRLWLNMLPARQ